MLITYLVALALGGTFVLASLLFGGDGDAQIDADFDADVDLDADMDLDADADVDADADADADAESHDHGGLVIDGLMAWLPVTSLRFWTFFAAFFGLTGTIFTAFGLISSPTVVAIISASIGYLAGWSIVALLRHLSRNQGDATVSERDYVGASGMVMIPVASDRIGKVRLELKGRTIDLLASTEDSTPLAAREPVMVYGVSGDHILVTRAA